MNRHRQVLEVGFHAGASARAFLSARGDVRVTSVDIGRHGHEEAFWHHTRRRFPARHTLVVGRSHAPPLPRQITDSGVTRTEH